MLNKVGATALHIPLQCFPKGVRMRRAFRTFVVGTGAAGLSMAAACLPVWAAEYPTKAVRFIVPYAPGSTDVQARVVADKLQQRMGQPFVIENRPGAATLIGAKYVATAAPDG